MDFSLLYCKLTGFIYNHNMLKRRINPFYILPGAFHNLTIFLLRIKKIDLCSSQGKLVFSLDDGRTKVTYLYPA